MFGRFLTSRIFMATEYVFGKNFGYRIGRAHKLIERGTVLVTGKDDDLISLAFKSGATISEVKSDVKAEETETKSEAPKGKK
jgi:hypothetical protein